MQNICHRDCQYNDQQERYTKRHDPTPLGRHRIAKPKLVAIKFHFFPPRVSCDFWQRPCTTKPVMHKGRASPYRPDRVRSRPRLQPNDFIFRRAGSLRSDPRGTMLKRAVSLRATRPVQQRQATSERACTTSKHSGQGGAGRSSLPTVPIQAGGVAQIAPD
jgi:hypothetical protein